MTQRPSRFTGAQSNADLVIDGGCHNYRYKCRCRCRPVGDSGPVDEWVSIFL